MKGRGCCLFLSVVVVIALVVVFTPCTRSLLSEARRVAEVSGYRYCWLSNTEIIELHETGYSRFEAYLMNVETGVKTRLTALEKALKFNIDRAISVSPDGNWLLCTPFDGEDDVHIVSMDGKRTLTWYVGGDTELPWIPGTSRWLRILPDPLYQNGSSWSLTKINVVDIDRPKKPPTILPVTPAVPYEDGLLMMVATKDSRLLLARKGIGSLPANALEIVECRREPAGIFPKRTWTLFYPGEEGGYEKIPVFTPQADRIAFTSIKEYRSSWRTFLARWFPQISNDPVDVVTLTVAHIDGSHKQEFLCDKKDAFIDNLQWRPDGKALSFNYDGNLYLLPVTP